MNSPNRIEKFYCAIHKPLTMATNHHFHPKNLSAISLINEYDLAVWVDWDDFFNNEVSDPPHCKTELINMSKVQLATNPLILNECEGQVQYQSEVTTARLGNREIRLESLTPILPPKEREERKREIENRLYDVFIKYAKKSAKI